MKVLFTIALCVLCLVFRSSTGQDCDKEFCDQCIQELNCFWCSAPKVGSSHCLPATQLSSCNTNDREQPSHSFEILEEVDLSESEQISPQRVKLKLRKNEKFDIKFRYRQSNNYPVDLYYIMDLSYSMEPSKDRLAELGEKLAEEMKRKTNNFQIGFGSFVDKVTMPYVNTHPENLKKQDPYSFRNHLNLTQDAALFSRRVKETRISGNLDSPEGGLDAIMQAMVCNDIIGWRPNTRHLLVMSTDAVSHIAGDGKLGGVIEQNDATCHVVNDSYTHGLIYDYPSVSQINYVARQNDINLIFAIVLQAKNKESDNRQLMDHYRAVSNSIENSKVGTLDEKSDNVVKFISDIYDKITESVSITSDTDDDVSVKITSSCPGSIGGTCSTVKPGQIIKFQATIEPLKCYKDAKSNKKIVKIKREGLQVSLLVELEVICDCACAANKQPLHKECNEQGDLECGVCRCNESRIGVNCECDRENNQGKVEEDLSQCVMPGSKNETCSGQGKCKCRKCKCKTRPDPTELIYGKYCQCDNFSCYLKCSGRGECKCGKCDCPEGWEGAGCECSKDTSQCISPDTGEMCSGHGTCKCGDCKCDTDGTERYSGKYCKECTSCPAQRCDELKPCVECLAYGTGTAYVNGTCAETCMAYNLTIIEKLTEKTGEGAKRCRVIAGKECTIVFEYSYSESNSLIITAEKKKICPEPPPLFAVILGVILTVLFIGIITLIIWKIVTTAHDKKEYARFLSERDMTKWSGGDNPLYKPGTSHFQNPAYKRASQRVSVGNAAKKAELESKAT